MKILYLEGDACSPKYIAGALEAGGAEVERVVAHAKDLAGEDFDLCVLSDYDAKTLGHANAQLLRDRITEGAGLLVVGGWRSFGAGGYARMPLADVFPVRMRDADDRVNAPSGLFLASDDVDHELLRGLPLDRPPVVTGYNDATPRADAEILLWARRVTSVRADRAELAQEKIPILLARDAGAGRTAAILTDLAPHWSGGWTDWGEERVRLEQGEEAGSAYVELLARLARWLARPEERASMRPESARRSP